MLSNTLKLQIHKAYLASDIHLNSFNYGIISDEFTFADRKNDCLFLLGDILESKKINIENNSPYLKFFKSISDSFKYVIIVLGNHDYWGSTLSSSKDKYKKLNILYSNIFILDSNYFIELNDYIVIGDTLWTDFNNKNPLSLINWSGTMNDSRYIYRDGTYNRPITANDIYNEHTYQLSNFKEKISNIDKDIIVLTHHAPSYESIPSLYKGSSFNDYYFSSLESLILDNKKIKVWCHGHIHNKNIYPIGECIIYNNAYGYNGEFNIPFSLMEVQL